MATCEVCGTEFDEMGVQIVVPGLAKSFDRTECAIRARNLAGSTARNVEPLPAAFVDLRPRGEPRSYGLHGLPAGLAAAFAGGRARLALGGASVAVALLVAATVHLSSRIGGGSDVSARSSALPSPPRNAGGFALGAQAAESRSTTSTPVVDTRAPAVKTRSTQGGGTNLIAHHSPVRTRPTSPSVTEPGGAEAPSRSERRKAPRPSSTTSRPTPTRAATSVSTRPGWGRGDKNHTHSGPPKHSGSPKHSGLPKHSVSPKHSGSGKSGKAHRRHK